MSSELKTVPIEQVRVNKVKLREVDRTSEDYLGLVDSIKINGFSGAITARPRTDGDSGEDYYEVIDGLHRLTAAKDAGITEIHLCIQDLSDEEVLVAQVLANAHKVETKPADYARQLRRIMGLNQLMTEAELASKLGKSPQWIKSILGLNKIEDEKIRQLVNSGKIKLMNAYALAKLPAEEQAAWVDRAMTQSPKEFCPQADARAKEIKDEGRKGKKAGEESFEPRSRLRKLKDIQAAAADRNFASKMVSANQVTDPTDAFLLGVNWCQSLDPQSQQKQVEENERRKAKREAEKEARKKEREAKKVKEQELLDEQAAKEAAKAHERLVHGGTVSE